MFELKPISPEAISNSLAKAERYRLLNEPREAESICRDILRTAPDHQEALVVLLLALTDQFGRGSAVRTEHARQPLGLLEGEYARAYYAGVICERWGKAQLERDTPRYVVYDWIAQAMQWYEKAEKLASPPTEDAALRWNTCVRILERNKALRPRSEDQAVEDGLLDDVPSQ